MISALLFAYSTVATPSPPVSSPPGWFLLILIAAIPVIGVWLGAHLSNKQNNRQNAANIASQAANLAAQLSHETIEKAKDRAGEMRRELYLRAVREMAKAGAFFGSLPIMDPTDRLALAEPANAFAQTAAEVKLVSSQDTCAEVSELISMFTELFIELMGAALPAQLIGLQLRDAKRALDGGHSAAANEISRLSLAQLHEINSYALHHLPKMLPISDQQARVIHELRKELELKSDLVELTAQMRAQWTRGRAAFEGFMPRLEPPVSNLAHAAQTKLP